MKILGKIADLWKKSIKKNAIQIRNEYIYWQLRWRQSVRAALAKIFFANKTQPVEIEHELLCANSKEAAFIVTEDRKSFISKEF